MNKQQGSAHVAVVLILVVALLGALGFIFWQNFINKDEAPKKVATTKTTETEQEEPEATIDTKQYVGSTYSFDYPSNGWLVVETRNDYDSNNTVNAEVRTTDYSPYVGMGIEYGAKVSVYTNANTSGVTLAQEKQNITSSLPDIDDAKDIMLGGVPAFSYGSGYEGYRYVTVAIKDGIYYQIVYQFADKTDQSVHRDGYDTIVKSFKFK